MAQPNYIELGCQSAFSFLEASSLPEDLIQRAAELGHSHLGLSDVHGVYGLPRFHQAAQQAGIRPIAGARLTLLGSDEKRRKSDPPPSGGRLTLLVENPQGYRNLCRLLSLGHANYPKPHCRVSREQLREHSEGLIALIRDPELYSLSELFPDSLFVELQRNAHPDEERRNHTLLATDLPAVASGGVRHTRRKGKRLLDALTCLHHKTTLAHAGQLLTPNGERHLHSPDDMTRLFRDQPAALANTLRIAERCEFTLQNLGYQFPEFPLGPGESMPGLLRELAYQGARGRYGGKLPIRVRRQLEHELKLIRKLGLEGYFLIVWDIVRECKARGILVQGRGSAANSLVCYALEITAVDPIRYELLFERFLSEERGEWPDIDLDLPSGDRREEILQYVYQRYGPHGAGMTANVITYRARSAVREMGKVLGLAENQINSLSKLLSRHEYTDDRDALEKQIQNSGLHPRAPRIRHLLALVDEIQNLPRHLSQHSGGMVIAQGRLDEVVPLEPARMNDRTVIQWDKEDCADLGIIKIDLLGLGMMAVLEDVIPLIRKHDRVNLDIAQLPSDDFKTYSMLQKADTVGVFQVESRAQMATLPRMKPTQFYDLVVEVAIIRPGPIVGKMVQPYLERRAGRQPVTYAHPDLEPILRRTLGVPLFQEQLLRMAMTIAGFSAGEAEELRRAMGFKRSAERMKSIVDNLRKGMNARGIRAEAQEEIMQHVQSFALYGFPESHAASFALLAYASAYIRAHHPACFLTAMLNCYPLGFYSPATLIKDSQRHGVQVRPVDIQFSQWECRIENDGAVRLGLRYVDGLRHGASERIAAAAPFASLDDLAHRADLHRDELEHLAEVGACASLQMKRREALWQAAAITRGPLAIPSQKRGSPLPEMSPLEQTLADYRGTGLTLGPQLMAHLRPELKRRGVLSASELGEHLNGRWVQVAGVIIVRQRPGTAKGFLFLTLEDETGMSNAVVFPDQFHKHRSLIQSAGILLVEGPVEAREGVIHVRARKFQRLDASPDIDGVEGAEGVEDAQLPPSHDFR